MARRRSWDPEPKYITRALAPLRRGRAGERRELARRMLLRLMGFSEREMEKFGPGQRPSHYGQNPLTPHAVLELRLVAEDLLRELGYDAAADDLVRWPSGSFDGGARDALEILEAGPPSVYLGDRVVFKKPMHFVRLYDFEFVVARLVGESVRPWYRFAVGKAVHDRGGNWVGWDREAGHTFDGAYKTLAEAKKGS